MTMAVLRAAVLQWLTCSRRFDSYASELAMRAFYYSQAGEFCDGRDSTRHKRNSIWNSWILAPRAKETT
jgi:hypothetical protein